MNDLIVGNITFGQAVAMAAMSQAEVDRVRELETTMLSLPQARIHTDHVFHAGMYARTIMIPAGVALTGAQVKIQTILIISGEVLVYRDGGAKHYAGYSVCLGQIGRKMAFLALQDTYLTMLFPTDATTVDEAEMQFTDEPDKLMSRKEEQ